MDLATLQLFCDLVETRSFTLAAERNFLSQSAVRTNSLMRTSPISTASLFGTATP